MAQCHDAAAAELMIEEENPECGETEMSGEIVPSGMFWEGEGWHTGSGTGLDLVNEVCCVGAGAQRQQGQGLQSQLLSQADSWGHFCDSLQTLVCLLDTDVNNVIWKKKGVKQPQCLLR